MLSQIAVGPQFQNFSSTTVYVASFLGHRASENLDCYPKMSIKKNIFKGYTWNKICFLACLKAKTEEKGGNKLVY